MECVYCGSIETLYVGVDDGGGAYGTSVCDEYECLECGNVFEGGCIDFPEDYEPDDSTDDSDYENETRSFYENALNSQDDIPF